MQIQQKGYFHSIAQFHIYDDKQLGTGSFGTVKLAVHIKTSKIYAIKIINLKCFTSENEYRLIEREICLHSQIDHPHIIKFWDAFCQSQLLYMVMQYAERGNLFYYQNTRTIFPETEAFKYFYQTSQALRFLHSRNIIHRDLKPQNLLLDSEYNIKLCDFGWGTQRVSIGKRTTFCGTYEYMAPEMLFENEYDEKIDIWALGILLYEILHGIAPFKGDSANDVKEKMVIGSYTISSHLSMECRDLIVGLLKFNPQDRMSFEELEQHAWVVRMAGTLARQHIQSVSSRNIHESKEINTSKHKNSMIRSINSQTHAHTQLTHLTHTSIQGHTSSSHKNSKKQLISFKSTQNLGAQRSKQKDKNSNLSATTLTNAMKIEDCSSGRKKLLNQDDESHKSPSKIKESEAKKTSHQQHLHQNLHRNILHTESTLSDHHHPQQKRTTPHTSKKKQKKSKNKNNLETLTSGARRRKSNDYISKQEREREKDGVATKEKEKGKSKSKSKSKDNKDGNKVKMSCCSGSNKKVVHMRARSNLGIEFSYRPAAGK